MDKEQERAYASHHMEKYGIKPCPFCGGSAFLEKNHRAFVNGQTAIMCFVRCVECNARSGREKLSDYGRKETSAEARNAAVKAWNRRISDG